MYTLYSMQRSGNSYKVRLGLARLGIPYRRVEIDILQGESRTPEFIAHRDFTPIMPVDDDALVEYARAHRVAAE